MANAKPTFTMPATNPLLLAINNESPEDTFRVKLLSIAQHKHAAAINKEPAQPFMIPCLSHDSNMPPITIRNIPKTILLSVCSLKKTQASMAVKTDSIFNRREADAALV